MPKDTDSVIFNDAEREILEAALQNPELSNAEIADQTGMRITFVRDTRAQYEDDVELADGVAKSDAETADSGSVTVDGAELSETQQAILNTAANNPTMMNADIAAETGARITLVRDTLDQHGDEIERAAESADDSEDDEAEERVSEPSDAQAAILELASESPELTNAEIAAETGARITLVRDTLAKFDGNRAVAADTDSGSAAVDDGEYSESQLEILEVALENPDLTNGEIAKQTGARITLVRDTIADYQSDDETSADADIDTDSGSSSSDEIPSEIDTEAFSETEIEILKTALANPELTNGEIAEQTGTRIALVRDTIHEHEYDDKPWDKDLDDEPEDDEDDETDAEATASTEEIEMPETTASDLLSDTEREILEVALENPELTNGEIAEQTGARLTLVRDTRATYEAEVDLADDSEGAEDPGAAQTATSSEPTERQREILDAIAANPDQSNGEIAEQTGARITLVRDTRAQFDHDEGESGSADAADESATAGETDTTEPAAESGGSSAGVVVGILLVLLLVIGVAASLGVI